jgi:hypothetical protein
MVVVLRIVILGNTNMSIVSLIMQNSFSVVLWTYPCSVTSFFKALIKT